MRQDEAAARASVPVAPVSPTPPAQSITRFTPPAPPKPREPSPEEQAEQAEWDEFTTASPDGKIAFFQERLASQRLEAEDAFEAYLQIRDATHPRHDAAARARLIELPEHLTRCAQGTSGQRNLPRRLDCICRDRRTLGSAPRFPAIADKKLDEFFRVIKMPLYHGQIQLLFAAMNSAWQKVSQADDIVDWGVSEFFGILLELVLYQYLATTLSPHTDDPGLLEAMRTFGGKPNQAWLTAAVAHLSASAPVAWRIEDFGETIDAETWEQNITALLFDWMADEHRRANVPFSKSDLFKEEMQKLLHQQISERAPKRKRKNAKSKTKRVSASVPDSPLIPRYLSGRAWDKQTECRATRQDAAAISGLGRRIGRRG